MSRNVGIILVPIRRNNTATHWYKGVLTALERMFLHIKLEFKVIFFRVQAVSSCKDRTLFCYRNEKKENRNVRKS